MRRRELWLISLLLAVDLDPVMAQSWDPHRLYEERCGRCHEDHARDFAQEGLRLENERVVGRRSGRDLRAFLAAGHGWLKQHEIDLLVDHLTGILQREAVFREKCRICHGRSLELARLSLIVKAGRLTGRYSGRDIAGFLTYHGRLKAEEVPILVGILTRHLETAGP